MFNEEEPIVSVPEVEAEAVPENKKLTAFILHSLAAIRQEEGISQQELSSRTGIAKSTVVSIENGNSVPSVETLNTLLGALGKTLVIAPLPGTDESRGKRYISMLFRDSEGNRCTINVVNPRLDVTREEVERVMREIIAGEVFLSTKGKKLVEIVDVRMTTVERMR